MGRYSPTVRPMPEPTPFWTGFNQELGRSLAQSPGDAIAWQRNRLAERELDQREKARIAAEAIRLQNSGYYPDASGVGDATGMDGTVFAGDTPYRRDMPRFAREQADMENIVTTAGIEGRARNIPLVEGAVNRAQGTTAPIGFGVDVNGQPAASGENPFAYHMSALAKQQYLLGGRMPNEGRSSRDGRTYAPVATERGYAWPDAETGEFVPARWANDGEPVRRPPSAGPARTEEDRIRAADDAFWATMYRNALKPASKYAPTPTDEEARRAADRALQERQNARRRNRILNTMPPDED